MRENKFKLQSLWCNSLKIFYNYCFLFTRVNVKCEKNKEKYKKDEIERRLKKVLKPEDEYTVNFYPGEHFSADHIPVFPLIFLKIPHIRVNCPSIDNMKIEGEIKQNDHTEKVNIYDITIETKLTLLDTGMGICRFEVEIDKENSNLNRFEKRHIIALSNTEEVRPGEQTRFRCDIKNKEGKIVNLFSIFNEEVRKLKKAVNVIDPDVKWIEKENDLVYHIEGIKESEDIGHFQDPYVTIFLEIPDNDYRRYLLDTDDDKKKQEDVKASRYYRDIATVLLIRSKENQSLDRCFVRKYVNNVVEDKLPDVKLVNMCSNSKFFMHLHTEVTLAMYSNKEKDAPLIKTSIVTLNKTISFLLMRWYSYVISNAWLDDKIAEIYEQFLKLVKGVPSSRSRQSFYEKQKEIIALRGDILGVLQDPITYRTSSGSSMVLYERGMEKFRIKKLQDILLSKIDNLDSLYNIVQKEAEMRRTKERISSFWKWFSGLFGVGVLAFALIVGLGPELGIILPRNPVVYLPYIFIVVTLVSFILVLIKGMRP